jgi:hypothetical protein
MKTTVRKLFVAVAALCVTALLASGVQAEWYYPFDDGVIPDSLRTDGYRQDLALSPTFSATASEGFLRMSDPVPASGGGSRWGSAFDSEEFPGDVRITAQVNMDESGLGNYQLWARTRASDGVAGYYAMLVLNPDWETGRLCLGKSTGSDFVQFFTANRVPNLYSS